MSEDGFSVLIIGCGRIAGGFDADRPVDALPLTHAGAFARHPGFRVTACVDPDDHVRGSFMARWNIPVGLSSVDQLTAGSYRFDVISICSPTHLHAAHFSTALALRPRLIFCEKPVTSSSAETRHWVEACEAHDVLLAINHTRRWAPDIVALAANLRDGRWGTVRSVVARYNKGVLNNGAHLIDLLHMLIGPVNVQATGDPVRDFFDDDPTIPALLVSASGVPVTLAIGDARDYALFELEIITEAAVIAMERGGLSWRIRRAVESAEFKDYRALGPDEIIEGRYDQAMQAAISNLHNALFQGAPLASTGASGLEAQLVCEAIQLAAQNKSTAKPEFSK